MYCNACGKPIAEDARFCAYCGTVLGQMPPPKKMMRPRANRSVAGVCAAVGHYLDLDVTVIRVVWALIVVMSGIFPGVIAYAIAWVVIPEEPLLLPAANVGQPVTHG
jgi:phage shock protein C